MKQLTMADFPNGVTLRDLVLNHCQGDEAQMWDLYFDGGMDTEVRSIFENCVPARVRTTAIMLRAFLRQIKKIQ